MAARPRVLVLRPEPQAGRMVAALEGLGLAAVAAPMLEIRPEPGAVARVLAGGGAPDVLVVTSAHAVAALAADPACATLFGVDVHAVGARTAEAARAAGFQRVSAAAGDGDALVRALLAAVPAGRTLVHAAGRDRAVDVAGRLAEAGVRARTAEVYRAEEAADLPPQVVRDLAAGRFDVAAVASRRTAEAFRRALGRTGLALPLGRPAAVAISAAAAEPLAGAFATVSVAASPDGEALTEGVVALARAVANNGEEHRPRPMR